MLLVAEVYILAVTLFQSIDGFPAVFSYFALLSPPAELAGQGLDAAGLAHPLISFSSLPVS